MSQPSPEIMQQYQRMRMEANTFGQKIAELEQDKHEHDLVLTALSDVSDDRKCYRMVGGVLVERNVQEVKPAVESNKEKLDEVISTLEKQLREKEKEIRDFSNEHDIRIGGTGSGSLSAQPGDAGKSGVLA